MQGLQWSYLVCWQKARCTAGGIPILSKQCQRHCQNNAFVHRTEWNLHPHHCVMNVDVFTVLRGLKSSVYFQLHKFSLWISGKELLWEKASCIALFDALFMRNGSSNAVKVYLTRCNPKDKMYRCAFQIYLPEICYFIATKGKTCKKPLSAHLAFIKTK